MPDYGGERAALLSDDQAVWALLVVAVVVYGPLLYLQVVWTWRGLREAWRGQTVGPPESDGD